MKEIMDIHFVYYDYVDTNIKFYYNYFGLNTICVEYTCEGMKIFKRFSFSSGLQEGEGLFKGKVLNTLLFV
jgi:hypothetical protein